MGGGGGGTLVIKNVDNFLIRIFVIYNLHKKKRVLKHADFFFLTVYRTSFRSHVPCAWIHHLPNMDGKY